MKRPENGFPTVWHGLVPDEKKTNDSSYVESVDDETFHIGQVYDNQTARTQRCKLCGATEFNVGLGSYFTAIRCVKCQWEESFRDG